MKLQNLKRDAKGYVVLDGRLFRKRLVATETIRQPLPVAQGVPSAEWIENKHFIFESKQRELLKEIIVDEEMANEMVKRAHIDTNHMGRDIMRLALEEYEINCCGGKEELIKKYMECDDCRHTKRFVPDEEGFTPITSSYPFERLQIDVSYPIELKTSSGRRYQATAKDHFSGKGWTEVIEKRDAKTLAKFLDTSIEDVDFPTDIVQLDGSEFKGEFMDTVTEHGSKTPFRGVGHPQSNRD